IPRMYLETSVSGTKGSDIYEFGQFRVDIRQRKLLSGGQPVAMTAKVFDTLAFLVQNHGDVVDKERLIQAIWPDTAVEEGNLHHSVSTVRKVLGEKPGEHRFIATVPGRGYSFVAAVRRIAPEADLLPQAETPSAPSLLARSHGRIWAAAILTIAIGLS